jgi:hypothetical protein
MPRVGAALDLHNLAPGQQGQAAEKNNEAARVRLSGLEESFCVRHAYCPISATS